MLVEPSRVEVSEEQRFDVAQREPRDLLLIDGRCCVLGSSFEQVDSSSAKTPLGSGACLEGEVLEAALQLLAEANRADGNGKASLIVGLSRVMRLTKLYTGGEALYALWSEPFRSSNSVARAMRRFSLTRRESEVLSSLIAGETAAEIAQRLNIALSTAQGYYKRLLYKTGSRNRAALVALVLGYSTPRRGRPAASDLPR